MVDGGTFPEKEVFVPCVNFAFDCASEPFQKKYYRLARSDLAAWARNLKEYYKFKTIKAKKDKIIIKIKAKKGMNYTV